MMLSVLIPTHNYKCYTLVADLQKQLEATGVSYEIIVAEDGSKDQVSIISNHRIDELPHCRHIIRRENVGRARIRNFLANEAQGEWLLFMDSDGKIVSNEFIQRYLNAAEGNADVIVGGLCNPPTQPTPDCALRYIYERKSEYQRTLEYRNAHPYDHFATFNFMIRKNTILQIPFDENCTEYGYEDALMGKELAQADKHIRHIDAPLMHMGFEPNSVYLHKIEVSLHTLHKIQHKIEDKSRITTIQSKIERLHLSWAVQTAYILVRPLVRRNLLSCHPSITLLSFYKLGYFLSIPRQH